MSFYISQATTQPQSQPNGANNNEVPIIGNSGAGIAIAIIGMLIGKWMPWGDLAKQFVGARTSKDLMSSNRQNQVVEAEIDINSQLSNTVASMADKGFSAMNESNKVLTDLIRQSVEASSSHAQSTQLLTEAKKYHAEATAEIAKAMMHIAEALQSLTQAQEVLPTEIKLAIEIYANEFRGVLEEIREEIKAHDIKSERRLNLMETRLKEQYTDVTAQFRRDLAEVKCHKPD